MDETTAPVLDPGRRRTKKDFFWAIAWDDYGHDGTDPPTCLFDMRRGEAPPSGSCRSIGGAYCNARVAQRRLWAIGFLARLLPDGASVGAEEETILKR